MFVVSVWGFVWFEGDIMVDNGRMWFFLLSFFKCFCGGLLVFFFGECVCGYNGGGCEVWKKFLGVYCECFGFGVIFCFVGVIGFCCKKDVFFVFCGFEIDNICCIVVFDSF